MVYQRVVISKFGPPDVLELVQEETRLEPEPGPGQVRIKVLASGVAFTDTMIRKGQYPGIKQKPPFSPGYDLVGIVDKLGEGVTDLALGERVAELTVTGAHSEYLCLDADDLVSVPDSLDPAKAVSLVLSYVTAYQMLHRVADVQPGKRILVHGAGGAVGSATLQLGQLLGLDMYGTASRPKHDLVSSLGATPIDYKREDFVERIAEETGDGVDAAFDPIGGEYFKRSFQTLRRGGKLVAYGFYNAIMGEGGSVPLDFIRLQLWNLLPNGRSTAFYSIGPWRKNHADWFRQDLSELFRLLAEGEIEPIIWKRISLDQVAQAHKMIEQAVPQGKIILTFD